MKPDQREQARLDRIEWLVRLRDSLRPTATEAIERVDAEIERLRRNHK